MPQCPLPLARLVAKMLKKQRRERYGSYEELIAALESVRAQLDPALAAPTAPPAAGVDERVGTDRRSDLSEAIPGNAEEGRRAAPTLPKSKWPLYGGIAAGLLVLGASAWLIWPKEEKLTKAQIYAREHAGNRKR